MKRFIQTSVFFLLTFSFFFTSATRTTAYLNVGYTKEKAAFNLKYKNDVFSYRVTSVFVLPSEIVTFQLQDAVQEGRFSLKGDIPSWAEPFPGIWVGRAPKKSGQYSMRVTDDISKESILLNVFVMVPYEKMKNGMINGYRIGDYPTPSKDKKDLYQRPLGFVEITAENRNTKISPHFKLGQFLCKQSGSYPKYVVIREKLPLKLEYLLEKLNEKGVPCNSFSVMSGYRTPYYNRAIGNVKYSRHLFGDAADIFVDSDPSENYVADLNGDGRRDERDGDYFFSMVNDLNNRLSSSPYVGGIGRYKATKAHGPFVHVDARGVLKRWGE